MEGDTDDSIYCDTIASRGNYTITLLNRRALTDVGNERMALWICQRTFQDRDDSLLWGFGVLVLRIKYNNFEQCIMEQQHLHIINIKIVIHPKLHDMWLKLLGCVGGSTLKLDGCIVWNAHNTVFGSKSLAICAQVVYFLHSMRPSVTWLNSRWWFAALRLSDVSVICRVFNPRRTSQEVWRGFFHGVYKPGELLWIDSNGKNRN